MTLGVCAMPAGVTRVVTSNTIRHHSNGIDISRQLAHAILELVPASKEVV